MAEKLRIGIIGCGGIAHAHANCYKNCDDVTVVAGADIIPRQGAQVSRRVRLERRDGL